MPINYSVRKKVDKSGEEPKELYYAVGKAVQRKGEGINEVDIARRLSKISSLTTGDVLAVLELLPYAVGDALKNGRTVNIRGFGTFFSSLTSEGVETPEELTADKVRISRICYKADKQLKKDVMSESLYSMERRIEKLEKNKKSNNK